MEAFLKIIGMITSLMAIAFIGMHIYLRFFDKEEPENIPKIKGWNSKS